MWRIFLVWMLEMALPETGLAMRAVLLTGTTESIAEAAHVLSQGHLVALPTETVYGLGGDGLNPQAVMKIFKAKGRPSDHPVILHVVDLDHAKSLSKSWPESADRLANAFWPGPLTMILRRSDRVLDLVTGGQDTVGIRMPSHPLARALLTEFSACGSGVIAAPSANRFGAVSPTQAAHVLAGIGPWLTEDDRILDGGPCSVGVESTIVDLSGPSPRLLRPGGLSAEKIAAVLGLSAATLRVTSDVDTTVPRVSGSLQSHYAPRAIAQLVTSGELSEAAKKILEKGSGQRVICLWRSAVSTPIVGVEIWPMPEDPEGYARVLYSCLHDADSAGADVLLIESPPSDVGWEAVADRLMRACAAR
jgi:L-threonylcarbamoyladenylate synthase